MRIVVNLFVYLFCLALLAGHVAGAEPPKETPPFECRWADAPITIDGRADEPIWNEAQVIDHFYLPWLQEKSRPAKTATKARLLWDRQYLYFFADMVDTDLYADITEHDGRLWENDVFELFFKPAEDQPGYYEFQVNAAGAILDMFIPRRGSGGFGRYVDDGKFHVEAKVVLRGTLNQWQDKDEGWSVEGRIPWTDFYRTGGRPAAGEEWKFALCRYDYSVDFEGPELSTCAPLKSLKHPDFHHHEDYAPLRFVGPADANSDSQSRASGNRRPYGIERLTPLTTSRVVGSPEPPPPYRPERALPKFDLSWPIFVVHEPGSQRLIFIDQERSYGPARIGRLVDDPATNEFETLLEIDGVAYSIAFHPQFDSNGWMYVGSNVPFSSKPRKSRVARYTLERQPPYRLLADSEQVILEWESDGHNGAAIAFGLDGMLYITTGDGTSDSDTDVVGQGLDHLLAKVLRIDVDRPTADRPYSVPPDNPFVDMPNARPETWAYGLRNPWRMTVDPQTGAIWVGNNGQDLWEQIYRVERGDNYGWSVYEGSHPFYPKRKLGPTPHVPPTLEHPHSEARSLTGGVVYYGDAMPELRGAYIYGDYSTGKIWGARHDGQQVTWHQELADTAFAISAINLDAEGELLIVDHRGDRQGGFYRLVPNTAETAHDPAAFPRTLTDSGLFASVKEHRVQPALIPYSVNAPLWSDGTYKERYIALPGESPKIDMRPNRGWDFPNGTVLVKSFALELVEGDPESRRWIETRFLTRQGNEWVGYSYAWNDRQTEATLVDKEGLDREFTVRSGDATRQHAWRYPSRTECMVCHSRAANFVLGLSTLQMNRDHDYGGVVDNQLRVLEHLDVLKVDALADFTTALREQLEGDGLPKKEIDRAVAQFRSPRNQRQPRLSGGLLAKPPEQYARMVDPYSKDEGIEERARSYLHANCAHCHVDAGGGNAQIDLAYTTKLSDMKAVDVPPLHDSFGLPDARLIAPGDPARSILLHRVATRGRGQMPQLATTLADEEAVEVIRQWIQQLEKTPAP